MSFTFIAINLLVDYIIKQLLFILLLLLFLCFCYFVMLSFEMLLELDSE